MLSDLLKPKSIVVLSTDSSLAEIYVYDTLKNKANSSKQAVIPVKDKKSFSDMLDKLAFEPMMADKWVFEIDYGAVKATYTKSKEILERCSTAYFLVKCDKYPDYLRAKEKISCTALYLNSLGALDLNFMFSGYLSRDLQRYLGKNYGVERCFELFNYFRNGGNPIENKNQIKEILGLGESSTKEFAFSLLSDYKGTRRSIKTQIRNKSKDISFLVESYGARKLQNFIISDIKRMLEIKQLYLEGILYDSVSKDRVPESYDFNKLRRYNLMFNDIVETPIERFLFLLKKLKNGYWKSSADALSFLYSYYNERQDY